MTKYYVENNLSSILPVILHDFSWKSPESSPLCHSQNRDYLSQIVELSVELMTERSRRGSYSGNLYLL